MTIKNMDLYKLTLKINGLALAILCGLPLLASAGQTAQEKYPATVSDGTAQVIQSDKVIDQEAVAKSEQKVAAQSAPAAATTATQAAATVVTPAAPMASPDTAKAPAKPPVVAEVKEQPKTEIKIEQKIEVKAEKPKAEPKAEIVKSENDSYDYVPNERIIEISERLKYVNEIVKLYGRAYDYKLNTSSKLKTILEKLDNERKLQAQHDNQASLGQ